MNGTSIRLERGANDIVNLTFDGPESVNKFDLETVEELRKAVGILVNENNVKGLIVSSAKSVFIVGADIKEFSSLFNNTEEEIKKAVVDFNGVFADFEALPFPTVAVIDGVCWEAALKWHWRVIFALPATKPELAFQK